MAARRVTNPSTSVSTTMSAWLMPYCGRPAVPLSSFTTSGRRPASPPASCPPLSGQQSTHGAAGGSRVGLGVAGATAGGDAGGGAGLALAAARAEGVAPGPAAAGAGPQATTMIARAARRRCVDSGMAP